MASTQISFSARSMKFRRLSALLLWFVMLVMLDAQPQTNEVQVLLSFRDQMAELPFVGHFSSSPVYMKRGYSSTWNSIDETPCAWLGVTCTPKSTVEQLDLSGWGLSWNLAVDSNDFRLGSLSSLTDLRVLDLSHNELTGLIPDVIGNFTGLTFLDLSWNKLKGPIPKDISACWSLRHLYLGNNGLYGEIPSLGDLVQLQVLSLAGNALTGEIPKSLGDMTALISIDLSRNSNLSGAVPSLPNLTDLFYLNLEENNFTSFAEPFLISPSLGELRLAQNSLEGMLPPSITNLRQPSTLDVSNNLLSGPIPPALSQVMNPGIHLDLSNNNFNGTIPSGILQSASYVNLSSNGLTGNILLSGATPPFNGTVLDLSGNQLSGPASAIFSNETTYFSVLVLENNLLSEDIVDAFAAGLWRASSLFLKHNRFTGDLSRISINQSFNAGDGLRNLSCLQTLDLSNNNLRMSGTQGLYNLVSVHFSRLGVLAIGGNDFSEASLPTSPFTQPGNNLTFLDLSDSRLKGEISNTVFNRDWLPKLVTLNISNNDITGVLPGSIFGPPLLGILDVSNNRLAGELSDIPPDSPIRLYPSTFDFFAAGNAMLCGGGDLIPSCPPSPLSGGLRFWVLLLIVAVAISATVALVFCSFGAWRLKVYRKRHQQDADLIQALQERETATLMPLRELKRATKDFSKSAWIGEGAFGSVYRGTLNDGTPVAIKKSKHKGSSVGGKHQFLNEVRVLSQVNHRYLVKLLGCCMESNTALLVFEFVPNGTLQEHLHGKLAALRLTWEQRLQIAIQTADALNYLHAAATFPIYHRDVKSANILLKQNLDVKVADFGISRLVPLEATHVSTAAVQGTMGYIDPEYFTSFQLNDRSDVYSFGVVLLELISAKPAIDFRRHGEETSLVIFAASRIENGDLDGLIDPALLETYSDSAGPGRESIMNFGRLALQCADMRSKNRPSMNEAWRELQNLLWEFKDAAGLRQGSAVDALFHLIDESKESALSAYSQ